MSELPRQNLASDSTNTFQSSRRIIKSLKAKADAKRTASEKVADWMTQTFGSVRFLAINAIWFFLWIVVNVNLIPGVPPFDPYPFGLLTMAVSLEAIILAIFVLISQNRASEINELREEIDLQMDIITEQELTKMMELTSKIAEKNRIDLSGDKVLKRMLRPTNLSLIEQVLEKQISNGKGKYH